MTTNIMALQELPSLNELSLTPDVDTEGCSLCTHTCGKTTSLT